MFFANMFKNVAGGGGGSSDPSQPKQGFFKGVINRGMSGEGRRPPAQGQQQAQPPQHALARAIRAPMQGPPPMVGGGAPQSMTMMQGGFTPPPQMPMQAGAMPMQPQAHWWDRR